MKLLEKIGAENVILGDGVTAISQVTMATLLVGPSIISREFAFNREYNSK